MPHPRLHSRAGRLAELAIEATNFKGYIFKDRTKRAPACASEVESYAGSSSNSSDAAASFSGEGMTLSEAKDANECEDRWRSIMELAAAAGEFSEPPSDAFWDEEEEAAVGGADAFSPQAALSRPAAVLARDAAGRAGPGTEEEVDYDGGEFYGPGWEESVTREGGLTLLSSFLEHVRPGFALPRSPARAAGLHHLPFASGVIPAPGRSEHLALCPRHRSPSCRLLR